MTSSFNFVIKEDNTSANQIALIHYLFCTSPYPSLNYNVYPGETFQVPVVAVGEGYEVVPTTVKSIITNYHAGNYPSRSSTHKQLLAMHKT